MAKDCKAGGGLGGQLGTGPTMDRRSSAKGGQMAAAAGGRWAAAERAGVIVGGGWRSGIGPDAGGFEDAGEVS